LHMVSTSQIENWSNISPALAFMSTKQQRKSTEGLDSITLES